MSRWRIDPAGVQRVVDVVSEDNADMHDALGEEQLAACYSGLDWGSSFTSMVPEALNRLMEDQQTNLTTIMNGIDAARLGVANATTAYNNGQEEMIGVFQSKAASAADDGDFSYFDQHGLLG
ncbi:DUF6507 family protein [Brachybacterium tyrofermentans]|uniref:DUF6507 family protein n=1 Tax=Brachybacterium tyrofermentans TaxID=47848 RepID=UPI003F8FA3DF